MWKRPHVDRRGGTILRGAIEAVDLLRDIGIVLGAQKYGVLVFVLSREEYLKADAAEAGPQV